MYGRDDAECDAVVQTGHRFRREVASRSYPTSYSEMNAILQRRPGLPGFDLSQEKDRAAMGHLLGRMDERDQADHPGLMIGSLVVYLKSNDVGTGFYNLARQRGLLQDGDPKEEFWIRQVRASHVLFKPKSAPQPGGSRDLASVNLTSATRWRDQRG